MCMYIYKCVCVHARACVCVRARECMHVYGMWNYLKLASTQSRQCLYLCYAVYFKTNRNNTILDHVTKSLIST